jgi:microcystin-dependent protein
MAIQAGDDILASHFNEIVPIGVIFPYGGSSAPTGFFLCDGSLKNRTTYAALFAIIGTTFGVGDGSTTFALPDTRSRMMIGAGAGTAAISFAHTAVDVGTNEITVPANDTLITGAAVVLTTTTTLPTGLSLATTYYVIRVSSTVIKLATNLANAVAGTAIDITGQGSGTHTATVTYSTRTLGAIGGEERHAVTVAETPSHTHTQDSHLHTIFAQLGTSSSNRRSETGSGNYSGTGAETGNTSSTTATNQNTGGSENHNIMNPYLVVNHIIKYISYT